MNREILFRGVALDTDKWIIGYGVIVMPETKTSFIIHKQGNNLHQHTEVIPETVGQFTGLTDKNGTKIFDGDILKSKTGHLFQVRFINSQWMAMGINPPSARGLTYEVFYATEITGNIHDNPTT